VSFKTRINKVLKIIPETMWFNYEQVEVLIKNIKWRTELVSVAKDWDDL